MANVVTVDFAARAAAAQAKVLEQEREILEQLKAVVARLQERAAGPDCPPGVGWRRGK